MKRLFILLMLSFSLGIFAQHSANRFEEESSRNIENSPQDHSSNNTQNLDADADDDNGPGNPGLDPVPINDYIPALLIIALGIIIHTTQQKKRKLLS